MNQQRSAPLVRETLARLVYRCSRVWRTVKKTVAGVWGKLFPKKERPAVSGDWTGESDIAAAPGFSLCRGSVFYLILFVAALLFTQVLRSRASHLFFLFVLLLPPVLLLYTLTAKLSLKVYLATDAETVEKLQPCRYELRVINSSIFAYPFIDAIFRLPRRDAVRTSQRRAQLMMAPFSTYTVSGDVSFRFRGTYEIGVACFYVYDFFRLFRVRVDAEVFETISVLPRKRMLDGSDAVAVSDIAKKTTRSPYAHDRLEVFDTREYRIGDSLKTIHWKLSSKSETPVVRDYSSGTSHRSILYCDLSARFPTEAPADMTEPEEKKPSRREARRKKRAAREEAIRAADRARIEREEERREDLSHWTADGARDADYKTTATKDPDIRELSEEEILRRTEDLARVAGEKIPAAPKDEATPDADPCALADSSYYADMNEFCADGVVELTVSAVLRELRAGNVCTLLWFDSRARLGAFGFDLSTEQDFDAIFRLFATAPLTPAENHVGKLHAMLGDTEGCKQIFVTSVLDRDVVARLCDIPGMSGGSDFGAAEVVYYDPEERFAHPAQHRAYLESCRAMLSANGLLPVNGTPRLSVDSERKGADAP